jgi:hypothetical protein
MRQIGPETGISRLSRPQKCLRRDAISADNGDARLRQPDIWADASEGMDFPVLVLSAANGFGVLQSEVTGIRHRITKPPIRKGAAIRLARSSKATRELTKPGPRDTACRTNAPLSFASQSRAGQQNQAGKLALDPRKTPLVRRRRASAKRLAKRDGVT